MSLLLTGIARLSQSFSPSTSYNHYAYESTSTSHGTSQTPLGTLNDTTTQPTQVSEVEPPENPEQDDSTEQQEQQAQAQDEPGQVNSEKQVDPPKRMFDVTRTALSCCAARALEYERGESKRLFDDFLAETLAGEEAMQKAREKGANGKTRLAIRTRYFDDFITESVEDMIHHDVHGIQVVLLGAGMDTRAYRLPIMATVSKVFEVDFRSVLELKEKLLETVKPAHPLPLVQDEEIHSVMADLDHDWATALVQQGFDRNSASIWLLEGLLYYFEESKVDEMLQEIGRLSLSGVSTLGFSAISMLNPSPTSNKNFISAMPDPQKALQKVGFRVDHIDIFQGARASYGRFPLDEIRGADAWRTERAGIYVTATKI